jgi:uncharacterized membrane protein
MRFYHGLAENVDSLRAVRDVNELYQRGLKRLDYLAIAVAKIVGSWSFIVGQTIFFGGWVALNLIGWAKSWDPYPFILMNLVLSLLGAYTAPLIIMAQNRDAERDRLMMLEDFETNRQAAEQIRKILKVLEEQGQQLALLLERRANEDRSRDIAERNDPIR